MVETIKWQTWLLGHKVKVPYVRCLAYGQLCV